MCTGFGAIVTKNLDLFFCEPDAEGDCSHTKILERLKKDDSDSLFNRGFVRIECTDWTIQSFAFDEESSLPAWAEEGRDRIYNLVNKTLLACATARAECEKVCATAWAECEKARAPAWAEYEKARAPARAECEKARAPAWAEYEKVCAPAWAEYEKVCATAQELMITRLSTIKGYIGEKL